MERIHLLHLGRFPYFVISLKCHILKSYNFSFLSVGRDSRFSFLFFSFFNSLRFRFTIFSLSCLGCLRVHNGLHRSQKYYSRTLYFLSILQIFSFTFHFNTTQFSFLPCVSLFFLRSVVFFSGKIIWPLFSYLCTFRFTFRSTISFAFV